MIRGAENSWTGMNESVRSEMADRDRIIGHALNVMGMVGVSSGIFLFTFAIVLILFRHGFGFELPNPFRWLW
jgi:hypothetical protein